MGRYRPRIPRAFGCQRGLALADLGCCMLDHLGPTPANLSPPSSFPWAATWRPCGLMSWGVEVWVAGAPTWPINPPEVYTPFGPDPLGRQAAGCPCQSIGWRLLFQSLCAGVWWVFLFMVVTLSSYHMVRRTWWPGWVGGSLYIGVWVSVDTVFYTIIRAAAIGTHSEGSYSILACADLRSQEDAIGEMPSPVFMK